MASVSMDLVKKLREKTQVGMMDCKKALVEADGDMEKAIELLRKKGVAVAAKRAGNVTQHGRIESYISQDYKKGALVQVACETDFSANTSDMKNFVVAIAKSAVEKGIEVVEALLKKDAEIKNLHEEMLAKISEKIDIIKIIFFAIQPNGIVNSYIHPGSTVGVMVEFETDSPVIGNQLESLKQAARDICMHIAVTNPLSISPGDLDGSILEKEQSVMKEQLKNSGKPENIIEKIMVGKINKYYEDVCLSKQKFIKNEDISIEKYLNEVGQKINNKVKIRNFVRFEISKK
jgi:elongation factor Ts